MNKKRTVFEDPAKTAARRVAKLLEKRIGPPLTEIEINGLLTKQLRIVEWEHKYGRDGRNRRHGRKAKTVIHARPTIKRAMRNRPRMR